MRRVLPIVALAILPCTPARGATIKTVFLIMMENHYLSEVQGNPDAPYFNTTLLPQSSYATNYRNPPGGIHPSLPNYLWLEAGTNFGILDDNPPADDHIASHDHLTQLLDGAGVSWKTYQEDIAGDTLPLTDSGLYAVRHNPFVYFDDTTGNGDRHDPYGLAHIRPYSELAADLSNHTVARYNFITPNAVNDMHDAGVGAGDQWLAANVPMILSSAAYQDDGALFIVFDEGSDDNDDPLPMLVLSPLAKGGGYHNAIAYDHSSTLLTMQNIFGVSPLLGAAVLATPLDDLFFDGAVPTQPVLWVPEPASAGCLWLAVPALLHRRRPVW